jgi:hypothetical protein
MEERSNKTIICSVLFLDIVEYSKKSVTGQIALKDRFNTYLSEAIHDVPVTDRIILDTGDGAAVNFLGDVEAALNAALRLRASLLSEDPALEPQLLVRIGINLGPVRLVRDINGQPNIVGDGINVAQRIMAFADPSQILVSRSYYDAVSRLSHQYTGMFHHQGSRTDKHVREHEIYAIGYPGDQTAKHMPLNANAEKLPDIGMLDRLRAIGRVAYPAALFEGIKQASAVRRVLYAATGVVILLAGVLLLMPRQSDETQPVVETQPIVETAQSAGAIPATSAVSATPTTRKSSSASSDKVVKTSPEKPSPKLVAQDKPKAEQAGKKTVVKSSDSHAQAKTAESTANKVSSDGAEPSQEAYISVSCKEGVQLFVDGAPKGTMGSEVKTVTTRAGKHKVIITHASFGIYSVDFVLEPGKTKSLKPKECN